MLQALLALAVVLLALLMHAIHQTKLELVEARSALERARAEHAGVMEPLSHRWRVWSSVARSWFSIKSMKQVAHDALHWVIVQDLVRCVLYVALPTSLPTHTVAWTHSLLLASLYLTNVTRLLLGREGLTELSTTLLQARRECVMRAPPIGWPDGGDEGVPRARARSGGGGVRSSLRGGEVARRVQ